MRSRSRAGFTLIELMVAMTLTLVIMAILSQAFVLALDTFSGLKGIGDMQQQLRTATILLKSDLGSDHFEGKRRLADYSSTNAAAQPMQAGFFAVKQFTLASATAGSAYFDEGSDQNGIKSYRAVDHFLYLTVKRRGNRQEEFFSTVLQGSAPTLTAFFGPKTAYNVSQADLADRTLGSPYNGSTQWPYASQWAEVVYFLVRTGSTEEPNIPASQLGTPTFALYRAQFVMVPNGTNLANQIANAQFSTFYGLSCNQNASGFLSFNSPEDAAAGQRAYDPMAFDPRGLDSGTFGTADPRLFASSTLVLPNVISFQVQGMRTSGTTFVDFPNSDQRHVTTPAQFPAAYLYDSATYSSANYVGGAKLGYKAVQITLRVWDFKTRQTRQNTIMQDL